MKVGLVKRDEVFASALRVVGPELAKKLTLTSQIVGFLDWIAMKLGSHPYLVESHLSTKFYCNRKSGSGFVETG